MKRILFGLATMVAAVAMFAPSAYAHGGQFRGPGGAVPPGLRDPSDPTPPPPPPSTPPPPTTPPTDPTSPPPATPATPTAPPPISPPGPLTGDGPAGTKPKGQTPVSFDQWVFWWNFNNDDILGLKENIYKIRGTPNSPLGVVGGAKGNRTDATRPTEKAVKEILIPALLWAMDPANKPHPDTESASYLALAKVADDPEQIKVLMHGAYKDGKDAKQINKDVDQIVRESALLSLGLLRRADAKDQFDAKLLDQIRDFLFTAFQDDDMDTRARNFAMLAIGLLGDQPTTRGGPATTGGGGLFYAPDPTSGMDAVIPRIVGLLRQKYPNQAEFQVSLILALSLQKGAGEYGDVKEALKECALRGKLWKDEVQGIVSAHAALALGKIGGAAEAKAMLNALTVRSTSNDVKRSAAIALGQLGRRVDGAERTEIAEALWKAFESVSDATAKNFCLISIAYLISADAAANRTNIIGARGVKIADQLIDVAARGKYQFRPFAALALGLIGREIGSQPSIIEYGVYRKNSIDTLLDGVTDQKMDKRSRGAFAIGLGMLREEAAIPKLVKIVGDAQEDKELRGYSAVALGMIENATPDVEKVIKEALMERSSEELRQQCAVALGLLGTQDAVPTLLKVLETADSQAVQGQVVLALAKIGDARAVKPLVDLLKDSAKPYLTRALACAGLGLIGDLEWIPSLARISKDINYRATTDALKEVLTIL